MQPPFPGVYRAETCGTGNAMKTAVITFAALAVTSVAAYAAYCIFC
jgi:hypothetical protein